MMLKSMVGLTFLLASQLAFAQDFQKTYTLAPGGYIVIGNVLGNLKVTGYDGKSVEIIARKKGPNSDRIEIVDRSFGNRIELFANYPPFHLGPSHIDCDVRVPRAVEYNFTLLSSAGNVEVSGVSGRLWAKSDRGTVGITDVRGWINAFSTSGNLNVVINRVQDRSNMRFSSISGNIQVSAPSDFEALIEMSSKSGFLKSDFPIDVQEARYGPGRLGRGKLGSGKQVLHIRSEFGHVSLVQK